MEYIIKQGVSMLLSGAAIVGAVLWLYIIFIGARD